MIGTWRCHLHSFAVGSAPARDFGISTYRAQLIMPNALNGERSWLQMADTRNRDWSFITYDPMAKQWVVTGIEWPVTYGVSTGTMRGNRLVVSGKATIFGRDYRLRQTYTKRSNDAFTILNEELSPDGTWIRDDEYDFVRATPHRRRP
jgi:hypothetical protein